MSSPGPGRGLSTSTPRCLACCRGAGGGPACPAGLSLSPCPRVHQRWAAFVRVGRLQGRKPCLWPPHPSTAPPPRPSPLGPVTSSPASEGGEWAEEGASAGATTQCPGAQPGFGSLLLPPGPLRAPALGLSCGPTRCCPAAGLAPACGARRAVSRALSPLPQGRGGSLGASIPWSLLSKGRSIARDPPQPSPVQRSQA